MPRLYSTASGYALKPSLVSWKRPSVASRSFSVKARVSQLVRRPLCHASTSLEFRSIATKVQLSPVAGSSGSGLFLSLDRMKLHASSICTSSTGTSLIRSSKNRSSFSPTWASRVRIVPWWFGVSLNRYEGPIVARGGVIRFRLVPFLGPDEAPRLIDLHVLNRHVLNPVLKEPFQLFAHVGQ